MSNPARWRWTWVAAAIGFALSFAVSVGGWRLAPAAVREHYHPDGDAERARVSNLVAGATLFGLLLVSLWACSRQRPLGFWLAAPFVVAAYLVAVFVCNLWSYLSAGGAFP